MPVPIAWLAAAGLGEHKIGEPELRDGALLATVSQVYAGRVLATREEAPTGAAARHAIRDLILQGRCFVGALPKLRERYDLAGLAVQVALTDRNARFSDAPLPEPLAPLPLWLLARLEALGLESGDDLALLDAADLMPPEPPADIAQVIQRNYPKSLNIGDASYRMLDRAAR